MKRLLTFFFFFLLLISVFTVAKADHTTNYIEYSITILGGGNAGTDTRALKKEIGGDAVVRLRKLYRQDTPDGDFVEASGYGWAEVWRVSPKVLATSTSGTVNKVISGNARTFIPFVSGQGEVGQNYTIRMRVPNDYNPNKQFRYTGSWSPDE